MVPPPERNSLGRRLARGSTPRATHPAIGVGGRSDGIGACHVGDPDGNSHFAGSRHTHAGPMPTNRTCRESRPLPNLRATINDGVKHMDPEQYPPIPALSRNENPRCPRLSGTDYQKSMLQVEADKSP